MNRADFVEFYNRLQATGTRYAECMKITRKDGVVMRFTSHDKNLQIQEDGGTFTYIAADSFKITALETSIGLAVSNLDITGIISDDSISESELIAGLFDNARINLLIAYWNKEGIGTLPLRASWVGEIVIQGSEFKADIRGIAQRLAQIFTSLTSLECRWGFCDANCGLNKATYTHSYTISEVESADTFTANILAAQYGKFQWGLCTFTSGENAGVSMEIIRNERNRLHLFLPVSFTIEVGDTISLVEGCDKVYQTCIDRYANSRYFGGEPFLTGSDLLVSYPLSVTVNEGKKGKF